MYYKVIPIMKEGIPIMKEKEKTLSLKSEDMKQQREES